MNEWQLRLKNKEIEEENGKKICKKKKERLDVDERTHQGLAVFSASIISL